MMGSGSDTFLKQLSESYKLDDGLSDWYAERKRKRIEEVEIKNKTDIL